RLRDVGEEERRRHTLSDEAPLHVGERDQNRVDLAGADERLESLERHVARHGPALTRRSALLPGTRGALESAMGSSRVRSTLLAGLLLAGVARAQPRPVPELSDYAVLGLGEVTIRAG